VFDELCALLDPGSEPFKPVKGKSNVIMFVGTFVVFFFRNGSALTDSDNRFAGCRQNHNSDQVGLLV